ncbi:uncharacterized protein LOC116188361 [Punica granatum]|uniref:Uncharacterized protein LOC116188361 n=2 Tax=Punica granatum TaxID=22663 RepID=A0A6P8BV48_PUNGR|nr:uncharacterized protein LOC116188361 [Punica granatum]XP_031373522.1 uncharacterized protein LOC116188361 [Punica granatum]PKI56534.1 hypothetical protein CRG98_023060 [Punica granatum]
METLVVVAAQPKHQYYPTESRSEGLARFNSSPPNKLQEINCRTFHAADGILPTPLRASTIPVTKQTPPSATPATPPSAEPGRSKPARRSSPIPISAKPICCEKFSDEGFFDGSLSFSERWAGPTYSNSPPPSSLPIPKFLQLPKRTKSLDLPSLASDDDVSVHPISKSAPASPVRGFSPPLASKDLFRSADSATKTLRRILNLEPSDE